jgi:hypothetical protein
LREAACDTPRHQAFGLELAQAALLERAVGEAATHGALIAYHQQNVLVSGDLRKPLANKKQAGSGDDSGSEFSNRGARTRRNLSTCSSLRGRRVMETPRRVRD